MPIDKVIPRFLVSDKDERLLGEGAMTDALNVTMSEDGAGTEGVIKNVKGTIAASGTFKGVAVGDAVKVIGQVSDPQRGYIYFFVADATSATDHADDAIYRYNTSDDTYELVFEDKQAWLQFDHTGFVKADVINGDFQQDGTQQTILYFTDNVNEPRKINVDRAVNGDFDNYSNSQLDYALNAIKAPLTVPPTAVFETESSVQSNNLTEKAFQFCTQLVYKDGEESVLSPISKLYFPSHYSTYGTSEGVFEAFNQNVCRISVGFNSSPKTIEDVEKIRVIGRVGNAGQFFIIDEVKVDEDKTRTVFGSSKTVYDAANGVYSFYNDGVYPAVDSVTSSKLYDYVPKKAQGQAIVGNRLMYSNYVEGFENHDPGATISVAYKNDLTESNEFSDDFVEYPLGSADKTKGNIYLDFSNITWPGDSPDTVPEGTIVSIRIDYDPEGSVSTSVSEGMAQVTITDFGSGSVMTDTYPEIHFGYKTAANKDASIELGSDTVTLAFSYVATENMTPAELTEAVKDVVSNLDNEYEKSFTVSSTDNFYIAPNSSGNFGYGQSSYITQNGFFGDDLGDGSQAQGFVDDEGKTIYGTMSVDNLDFTVTYKFDDVSYTSGDTNFTIKPYISKAEVTGFEFDGNISDGTGTVTWSSSSVSSFTRSSTSYSIQSSLTFAITNTTTDETGYIPFSESFTNISNATSSFKHGSSHPLGVVYYDKFGRHGSVNSIGSAYVKSLHERTVNGGSNPALNKGPCELQVSFSNNAPDWADSFHLVYGGPSEIDSFLVTGVGVGRAVDSDHSATSKRIYVSLKPLDLYEDERSSNRSYTFTEGDKLRVLFNTGTDGSLNYKNSNSGGPMEFNVVGVVDNPVDDGIVLSGDTYADTADALSGTWIALEAPVISAGGLTDDGPDAGSALDNVSYDGYDYFSLSSNDYPNGDSSPDNNYWQNGTVVQIYKPKKTVAASVYYEIGERRKVLSSGYGGQGEPATNHGETINTMSGSVWWRPITFTVPEEADGVDPPLSDWAETSYYVENETPSEITDSKDWHRGKAHLVNESASEIRRGNGIIYSDIYSEDIAWLSLSSFNVNNYDSFEAKFGNAEYIGNYNDDLVAIQKNKLCLVPVNKNILEYASGSSDVAVSSNVLGQRRYASGDYGTDGHPESVLIQDNNVFFADKSRQAVCGLIGGQLVPISEKGMSSFFQDFFSSNNTHYISGYDPRDGIYFISAIGGTTEETVGYNLPGGFWQSKYSFTPYIYANQNNMLYSSKLSAYDANDIFWRHDSSTYNSFYGDGHDSYVEVVSKISPSRVKVYNALSIEADSKDWGVSTGALDIKTSSGQKGQSIFSSDWKEFEDSYYVEMPRDSRESSDNDSINLYIGVLTHVSGRTYTSDRRLNRLPIPIDEDIKVGSDTLQVESVSGNKITFNGDIATDDAFDGDAVSLILEASSGDKLRGHWLRLKLTTATGTGGTKHELYCINFHVSDSKSHHPLGE